MSEAEIIAGDFLLMRRYLPESLEGKVIVTNTVTSKDVELLRERIDRQLDTLNDERLYQGDGDRPAPRGLSLSPCPRARLGCPPDPPLREVRPSVPHASVFTHRL